ncbi:PorP/SprF family type IX secretion system membrane protein [Pedobacter hartonius]|uniref:Type IX secretion system membrane protein, PorP/SprF family n=1 Tax=Pedobacter hartonius TaxID=425514 RepID=A0A1H4GMI9_9SPHI|nr:PorP/SprF family type IX secretion system membrane protein [Pedobacter hartonius]SEB10220.1 type IX secretion system membrane protein, PorP/SprF family [Pedobacter hartonius]
MRHLTLTFIFVFLYLCIAVQVKAQRNPLGSQFFNNPYIINPAMAGSEQGLRLNGAFRRQKDAAPGGPQTQNLTAEYGFGKAGAGLNLNNDRAGLLRETRIMATYAYHLPLDGADQYLHFGVSAGLRSQRIDVGDLSGDVGDILIGQYNDRQNYFDGDFGTSYTSGSLTVQAAVLNLKHFFKKDVIEINGRETFYTAVSYRIYLTAAGSADFTPLVAYRGADKADNIWDAGGQLSLADRRVFLSALYHSNDIATFGIGLNYLGKYLISGLYNVNTAGLNENTNGSFEIGFGVKF